MIVTTVGLGVSSSISSEKVKVKVTWSWPTLFYPVAYTVHGILQARTLEWVTVPFSGDRPNPGIEPRSLALQAGSLPAEPPGKPSICACEHMCG